MVIGPTGNAGELCYFKRDGTEPEDDGKAFEKEDIERPRSSVVAIGERV